MKKKIIRSLLILAMILVTGLFLQAKSSFLYSDPVMKVEEANIKVAENMQEIKGRLLNAPGKVTINETYYENEGLSPAYQKGEQLILQKHGGKWQVLSLKRDGYVFILVGIFIWIVLLISGRKGIYALIGLGMNSLLLVLFLWINLNNRSLPLLFLMSIYTVLAVLIAMGTSYGFKNLDLRKIIGTLLSVFLAFIICLIAMNQLRDNGIWFEEMQFVTRPYRSVFLAGLLIGAIGASMDNIVTIISSLDEIQAKNHQLSVKELVRSGQEIAQDTASSMINVLMFAYLSGAIPSFVFNLANGWNFSDTFGLHLSLEILRAICGGFAIVLSVPLALTAFIVAENLKRRRKAQ
ncbi:YibE/F family protein [Enterococcus sp. AZ072]|uniref:YibE/F family protein n=1 Tax=unclassified Enterococcus TaxID=2608891 RepID=UPI003D2810A8